MAIIICIQTETDPYQQWIRLYKKRITAAHELGHAIIHPNANTPFLKNNTFFSVDKLEIEANKFVAELLICNDEVSRCDEYTIEQIARSLNLRKELVHLKYYGTYS